MAEIKRLHKYTYRLIFKKKVQFLNKNNSKYIDLDKTRSMTLLSYLFNRQTSLSVNDGRWHHVCATWENTAGSWKLYKDGKIRAAGKGFKQVYFPL